MGANTWNQWRKNWIWSQYEDGDLPVLYDISLMCGGDLIKWRETGLKDFPTNLIHVIYEPSKVKVPMIWCINNGANRSNPTSTGWYSDGNITIYSSIDSGGLVISRHPSQKRRIMGGLERGMTEIIWQEHWARLDSWFLDATWTPAVDMVGKIDSGGILDFSCTKVIIVSTTTI